ncbi:unnamed protein product [Polarella glacialis]|uniref:Pentatricopeptide repeat-containing protein, chloroplastic n=1 Tax=Polarella glacialis TaxID=89957 RepID=A0A813I0E8_POLGL|nr:unnamed protein product [Polarella glacialis]
MGSRGAARALNGAGLSSKQRTALAAEFGRRAEWAAAIALIDAAWLRGEEVHAATCGAAVGSCQAGARWQHALGLLTAMGQQRGRANAACLLLGIGACGRESQWQQALAALSPVLPMPCDSTGFAMPMPEPDAACFNAAVAACARGAAWAAALATVAWMVVRRVQPTAVSLNSAISAAEKASQWSWSLELLTRGPKMLSLPGRDTVGVNAAMSACGRASQEAVGAFATAIWFNAALAM